MITGLLSLMCGISLFLPSQSVTHLACEHSVLSPAEYKLMQHTHFSQMAVVLALNNY